MCDYPFFIPQVVLFANSSLFWFKVTNEHREFRNYLFISIAYFHLLNNKKGTSLRKSQCLICGSPDFLHPEHQKCGTFRHVGFAYAAGDGDGDHSFYVAQAGLHESAGT